MMNFEPLFLHKCILFYKLQAGNWMSCGPKSVVYSDKYILQVYLNSSFAKGSVFILRHNFNHRY